ncbi:MAG: hypothetical protein ABIR24_05935 [Verrucomicrobiota bacterium]
MILEITLPAELTKAAESLETRLQLLRVPTRKVSLAEWNSTPVAIHPLIPRWIPSLLANFSLLGSVLECQHNEAERAWPRCFCFWGPAEYTRNLSGNSSYCFKDEFIADGLVMISDESDGDMWLASIEDPSSPIYLYSITWQERFFASSRISLLMASMAVSPESFTSFGKSEQPQSVMWLSERK